MFKILKPGVEERLEQELELFERVGAYLDERCDDFRIPHLDYRESFEQVRGKLRHEVRLDLEQRHLAQARAAYAGEPRVLVPALFAHCTPRVTAMERVTGRKVTEHRLGSTSAERRLAELVLDALIARPFFSRASQALFHGDPHPGNLFLTADRRLAILDWSLVGSLGERERAAVVQVALGGLMVAVLVSGLRTSMMRECGTPRPQDWLSPGRLSYRRCFCRTAPLRPSLPRKSSTGRRPR